MPDHDHEIGIHEQPVALDSIAHLVDAEILQIGRFAVVVDEAAGIELIDDFLAEIPVEFFEIVLTM